MVAFALRQILDRPIFKTELVEPIKCLRCKQEQSLIAFHLAKRNQVTHNRFANARLAVVRADRNARHFGHVVFERMQRTATVDAVVDAIHNIIAQLLGNGILRTRHQVALRDVILHNAQDIRDVFDVRRTDARILVRIHHRPVTAGREHFLQHAALEFTAQQMHAVRPRLASMDCIHQVIHLRKSEHVRVEFQKFLRLIDIHCRNQPVVRRLQVLRILAGHKPFELDAALATDKKQLADLQVLAEFRGKFRTRNIVGMPNLVPANRRNNRHKPFIHELLQQVALDAFDASGTHVVDAVNHAHAACQNPVALDAAEPACREVAHDALRNTQRCLLDKRQSLFARKPYAVAKFRFEIPRLELSVDAVSRARHNDNADTRLVQKGDIAHQHREHRMVHQAIVNLQDKQLALEPVHIAKHFPDEPGHFEVLRIKIRRCVTHELKSSNRKAEDRASSAFFKP